MESVSAFDCVWEIKKSGFLCRVLLLIINVTSHFMKALNSAYFIDARKPSGYLTCVYSLATEEMKIMKRPTIFISHVKYIRRWWILRCNSGIKVPLHTWAGNTDVCFGTLNVECSYYAPYQTCSWWAWHFRSPNDPVEKRSSQSTPHNVLLEKKNKTDSRNEQIDPSRTLVYNPAYLIKRTKFD